jgi:hypothetical protein
MPTNSDVRMAKFKAAIDRCREGDPSALEGCEIIWSPAPSFTLGNNVFDKNYKSVP